jgi:hypothetical protein
MAQAGRTVPSGPGATDGCPAFFGQPAFAPGPPEGLHAVDAALARGLAAVGEALAALDRAARLLDDQRWLLESLADPRATPSERFAAMRGFATARRRLRGVSDGIALLDGSLPRGLRVITGIDAGAIVVSPVDLRPAFAAIAEAPSPRVAAAMLSPYGAIAEAAGAVTAAQRRLAADQRRLRNRQSLNAALTRAWGDGSAPPPPTLLRKLAALLRPWAPAR